MDFDRHTFPPGGWAFYQAQTKWSAPTPISSTFDQSVVLIIKHRLANAAITAKFGLATDPVNVGNELEAYTHARLGIPSPKLVPQPAVPSPSALAGAAAGLRKMAAGAATIVDWLTSGAGAVPAEQSAKRAAHCLICPKHSTQELSSWFSAPVAALIKKELERRTDLKLSTPVDDKLGICTACSCDMRLKTHAPLDVILKHLKADTRAAHWENCWITHSG